MRGFDAVSAIVLLSVLLYQLMIYYNCKTKKTNPKSIKYMALANEIEFWIKIRNIKL